MKEVSQENKVWKIAKIVLNVIFYLFIALLLLFSISNIGVKDNLDIPNLFGKGFSTVLTSSMDGEEESSFTKNDIIFLNVVNDNNRDKVIDSLKVGDSITFSYNVKGDDGTSLGIILNTHRIVDIKTDDASGKTYFLTQGDKVAMDQSKKYDPENETTLSYIETVSEDNILAVYTGKWTGAGKTMKYLQTSTGFMVCIVLPTAAFFIFEIIMLILNFMKIKTQKSAEENKKLHEEELAKAKAELEKEKEKMREELLAEMNQKKNEEQEK